jgi:hypothetical protein
VPSAPAGFEQIEVEAGTEHIHQRALLPARWISSVETARQSPADINSRLARNKPLAVNSSPASASSTQSHGD